MKKIAQIILAIFASSIPLDIAINAKIYKYLSVFQNISFFLFLGLFTVIVSVNYYYFLKKRDVFGKTIW